MKDLYLKIGPLILAIGIIKLIADWIFSDSAIISLIVIFIGAIFISLYFQKEKEEAVANTKKEIRPSLQTDPYAEELKSARKKLFARASAAYDDLKQTLVQTTPPIATIRMRINLDSADELNQGQELYVDTYDGVVSDDFNDVGQINIDDLEDIDAPIGATFIYSGRRSLLVYDFGFTPGHREWSLPLVGIPYNNRATAVNRAGAGPVVLEPFNYQGKPAIRVLDPLGSELGFLPAEHAEEIEQKLNQGKITIALLSDIKNLDGKTFARVTLVLRNYPPILR